MALLSGWREVRFVGGSLDGQSRMVMAGPLRQLVDEIRIDAPAGQHEVYQLQVDERMIGSEQAVYRNARYVLRA